MEEKNLVYEVVLTIWNLAKKYGFGKLHNEEWESLIQEAMQNQRKYAQIDSSIERLFRDMYGALEAYYERKNNEQNV